MLHMFIPVLAAVSLGAHPLERRKRPHPPAPPPILTAAGPSVAQERALRRRLIGLPPGEPVMADPAVIEREVAEELETASPRRADQRLEGLLTAEERIDLVE